jgi:hypothetical protein
MKRIPLLGQTTARVLVAVWLFMGAGGNESKAADRGAPVGVKSSSPVKPATADLSKAEPIRKEKIPDDVAALYSEAAEACGSYSKALPYERSKILDTAVPLVQKLVTASEQSQRQNPRAQNAFQLFELDYHFSELWNQKEIQAALGTNSRALGRPVLAKTTVKDPGGLAEQETPPAAAPGQPVAISSFGPDALIAGGRALGEHAGNMARALHLDGVMTKEAQRLLTLAVSKGDGWRQTLDLVSADKLETRAAKVALRAAFGDLLGNIVAFRGSYFLGVSQDGQAPQVWEFKQPITLGLERHEPDIRTKLNTGIQLIVLLTYNPEGPHGFFRRYANGWWGSWTNFPKLADIKITKGDNWTIELPKGFEHPTFSRPSLQELELVLSRSDSTKLVGVAEAALNENTGDLSEEDALTLLVVYGAHGDLKAAHKVARLLLQRPSLTAGSAKQTAAALANVLAFENPAIAADFFRAKFFDYYQAYKEFPENGEMVQLPVPKRGTAKHPYGTNSIVETAEELKLAYRAILEQEPQNLDAQFDLALLYMLGDSASRGEVLDSLRAVAKSKTPSPDSGRDFRNLITGSPSFFLLRAEHTPAENEFRSLLRSLGSSDVQYGSRFAKQVEYYNSGY